MAQELAAAVRHTAEERRIAVGLPAVAAHTAEAGPDMEAGLGTAAEHSSVLGPRSGAARSPARLELMGLDQSG